MALNECNETQSDIALKTLKKRIKEDPLIEARLLLSTPLENHLYAIYEHLQETYMLIYRTGGMEKPIINQQLRSYERRFLPEIKKRITKPIKNWIVDENKHNSTVLKETRKRAINYKKDFDNERTSRRLHKSAPIEYFKRSLLDLQAEFHAVMGYVEINKVNDLIQEARSELAPEFFSTILPSLTRLSPYSSNPVGLTEDMIERLKKQSFDVQKEFMQGAKAYIDKRVEWFEEAINSAINGSGDLLEEDIKEKARVYRGVREQIFIVNRNINHKINRIEFNPYNNNGQGTYAGELDKIMNAAEDKIFPKDDSDIERPKMYYMYCNELVKEE